ncbi:MAG: hypothetical protein ACI9UN_004501, partial [Granulosicoccus sp.]
PSMQRESPDPAKVLCTVLLFPGGWQHHCTLALASIHKVLARNDVKPFEKRNLNTFGTNVLILVI